jgi:2-amino-4-hydroxy-6-hydroxymethyldihydropteridine diphosphokinase
MILIALGANMPSPAGSPSRTIHAAIAELRRADITARAISSLYETEAWPDASAPAFINAVIAIYTSLSPAALLSRLHEMEFQFGRVRSARNAPRSLDLDILDYDGRVEDGPPILPHPRLDARGFVLIPLRDVAPDWRHPVSGRSVEELIAALPQAARAVRRIA